jgi:predicted metal-dependent hydrolase
MDPLFEEGIKFFNAGRYFEAHEVWEDLWRQTQGPLRLFYQGLIQAAVGLHHLNQGNWNGAQGQLRKSLSKLEAYPTEYSGIHNDRLIADIRRALAHMQPCRVGIARL